MVAKHFVALHDVNVYANNDKAKSQGVKRPQLHLQLPVAVLKNRIACHPGYGYGQYGYVDRDFSLVKNFLFFNNVKFVALFGFFCAC